MADFDTVTQKVLTLVGGFFDQDLCHVGFVATMSQSLKSWQASGGKVILPTRPKTNVYCALVAWKAACLLRLSQSIPLSPVS